MDRSTRAVVSAILGGAVLLINGEPPRVSIVSSVASTQGVYVSNTTSDDEVLALLPRRVEPAEQS
jgi:hypothetical protein